MKILSITPNNVTNYTSSRGNYVKQSNPNCAFAGDNYINQDITNSVYKSYYAQKINFGSSLPRNFGEVTENLCRGARPTSKEHIKALQEIGVTVIMDLEAGVIHGYEKMAQKKKIECLSVNGYNFIKDNTQDGLLFQTAKKIEGLIASGQKCYVCSENGATTPGVLIAFFQSKILGIPLDKVKEHYFKHFGDKDYFYLLQSNHLS